MGDIPRSRPQTSFEKPRLRPTVVAVISIWGLTAGAAWADSSNGATNPGHPIQLMHQDPWFFTVAAASMAGWILGAVKGFSTSSDWLKRYIEKPPAPAIFVADLLVFVVAGAYFGTGIYSPTNFVSAIAAGLTWPIGLGALATTDRPVPKNQPDAAAAGRCSRRKIGFVYNNRNNCSAVYGYLRCADNILQNAREILNDTWKFAHTRLQSSHSRPRNVAGEKGASAPLFA